MPDAPTRANTYLKKVWGSAAHPAKLKCDDGYTYVVKGSQNGRMIFNDHVVATLGAKLGAPVPAVRMVDVPPTLIEAEPELKAAGFAPGLGHGSREIDQVSPDREGLAHCDQASNRSRFAVLAWPNDQVSKIGH